MCKDKGKIHPVTGFEGLDRLQSHSTYKYTYVTSIYCTLSGCYMFRLVAILRELKTK
jgi:hypothetical protein